MLLHWIPLFPLVGFLINGLWYAFGQAPQGRKKAGANVTGVLASLAIGASFVVSVAYFLKLRALPEDARVIEEVLFPWIQAGGLSVDMTLRVDSLSTLFTMVICGVGTLIHVYSIGYMGHDATPGKFFAYLNLFCFAMLMLVLGGSLPILFLGWEGVVLCSYLLIGYWYTDMEKAIAGKKAFVVNRVGDLGFLLGMFLIFTHFNTLDFEALKSLFMHGEHGAALPHGVSQASLFAMCLLLFVGCMGKSAQIPLYVWLPDAMAGPTPVSALIHAATMVTSGVYLIARLNFFYTLSPEALAIVAVIGAATAFFAATIAIVQTDIKKILAYSTVSQLGYMFLGCGVGAYTAGVFHVITHAFFKALLFLGAGSVIHGMHEEQDILKMGGLKKYMPRTFAVFVIAWLAISGIPPFSGFFSKDEILWKAFSSPHGSIWLWAVGALTAVLTAFYMTRLVVLTFFGQPRFEESKSAKHSNVASISHGHSSAQTHDHGAHSGVHESPWIMLAPLMILAALSALGGFMGVPHSSWLDEWLVPVIPESHGLADGINASMEWILMVVSILGAIGGILFAFKFYSKLDWPAAVKARFAGLHRILTNKWYVDEFYDFAFVRSIGGLARGLWKGFDVAVIDRVVNGVGQVTAWTGQTVRVIQTGSLQVYAFVLLMGFVVTVGYLLYGMV